MVTFSKRIMRVVRLYGLGDRTPAGRECPAAQEPAPQVHLRGYDALLGLRGPGDLSALRPRAFSRSEPTVAFVELADRASRPRRGRTHASSRSALRFQRIPASMKPSMSPSNTPLALPTS